MTPVVSWSPADYYRASRAARRAWARTSAQLELGLDEPQVSRAAGNSAAACGSSSPPFAAVAESPRGGLDVPETDAV